MYKKNYKQTLKIFTCVILLFLFFAGCKKNTQDLFDTNKEDLLIREMFFNTPSNISNNLKSIIQKIKKQDSTFNFVPNLVKQLGYASWENALESIAKSNQVRELNADSIITFIPFNQNNSTAAFLICVQFNDSFLFKLEIKNRLFNYNFTPITDTITKKKQLAKLSTLTYFEKRCNNKDSLLVNNSSIKSIKNATINFTNKMNNGRSSSWGFMEIEICSWVTVEYTNYGNGDPVGGWGYQDVWQCSYSTILAYLDDSGNGSGTNGGGYDWWTSGGGVNGNAGTIGFLSYNLNLTQDGINFLIANPSLQDELYHYIISNNTTEAKAIAREHIDRMMNDPSYLQFVVNHLSTGTPNTVWWMDDTFLLQQGGVSFGTWAINYLIQNQNLSFAIFENWFFKVPEFTGGETIIDPDQITYDQPIQQVALPSLSSFETYFPKNGTSGSYSQMSSSDVYQLVGSTLYTNHQSGNPNYQNACAIRGSRALLYAGITIPVLRYNGSQRTEKGSDNKNYILDAVSFNKFMIDKFGDTPNKLIGADANDPQKVAAFLNGKNGIYVIVNNDGTVNGAGYSGHVDLILNGSCIGGAYTTPTGGVKSIRIWVLN